MMLLVASALAVPTPEEDALAAALAGRNADAVAALSRAGQPESDQAAALYALQSGLLGPAARLILRNGPAWTGWARVDLLARQGNVVEAARLALAEMDAALAGEHRAALVDQVVAWANERSDAQGASQLLEAAITIGGGAKASDALLALPVRDPGHVAWETAAARRAAGDRSMDVARVLGVRLAARDAWRALPLLVEATHGEHASASIAARVLSDLKILPDEVAGALAALAARFPEDADIARRRLAHATALLERDRARGLAELDALADDTIVGTDARTLAASKEPTPARRGARWRAIAEWATGSALGKRAADEALSALRAEVGAIADPAARRARAVKALTEPGASTDPTLLFAAAPAEGRTEALRSLAARFPRGPWCSELAELEVRAGADRAHATAWRAVCDPVDAWGRALSALSTEEPWLTLIPADGGVDAIVAGVATLSVAQHVVDAEAIFASGERNPLDTPLDAVLVSPTRSWSVSAEDGRATVVHIPARGAEPLTALTVRAADLRGTLLVTRETLRIVGVRVADELALGVLSGETPVPGASLRVQLEGGSQRAVRTGADGIARLTGLDGSVRVMASRGRAIGFAAFASAGAAPADNVRVDLVLWEGGVTTDTRGHVSVFTPTVSGARAPAVLTLVSLDSGGHPVDEARVTLADGAGSAQLWMTPGGRLEAREGKEVRGSLGVPGMSATDSPVAVSVRGDLRDSLTVDVWPRVTMPPEGIPLQIGVDTPWSKTTRTVLVTGPERVSTEVPLVAAAAGDPVAVSVGVPGEAPVLVTLKVPPEGLPEPVPTPGAAATTASEVALAVLHQDHVLRAWFAHPGEDVAAGVPAGDSLAWIALSNGPAVRIEPRAPVGLGVAGTLKRGSSANLTFSGVPAGTRVWAWVTDASDFSRVPTPIGLPLGWSGVAGTPADPFSRSWIDGETIAAGLLAEEERRREAADPTRLDYGFSGGAELAGGLGARGSGIGGGGTADGVGGMGTRGRGAGSSGRNGRSPGVDPGVFAALEGVAADEWAVTVPPWVTRAWVRAVARTPDGRWATTRVAVPVEGGAVARYEAPTPSAPHVDENADSLMAIALQVRGDARILALAGLRRAGVAGAEAPLRAAEPGSREGRGMVLVARLTGEGWTQGADSSAIPDPRLSDRARQALLLASASPDRALAAARRLLSTPGAEGELPVPDDVQAEAGLALWAANAPESEVRAALTGGGPYTTLARAVAIEPEAAHAALYRAVAESPHADPVFRAQAVVALAGLTPQARVGGAPPPAPSVGSLGLVLQAPQASWHGEVFQRGVGDLGQVPLRLDPFRTVHAGQRVPLSVELPARSFPTRLECPDRTITPQPRTTAHTYACSVTAGAPGETRWEVWEYTELGVPLASAAVDVEVLAGPPPLEAATPYERYQLGLAILGERPKEGRALLAGLLREEGLASGRVVSITERLLEATIAEKAGPADVQAPFTRYRELVPEGALGLPAAAAVAHAFADDDPARAITAAKVVMDGRFREELAAVDVIRAAGLDLTALKLLRELAFRYPETPTVARARAAAPTLLLARADGEGDRLGYTRSSLRHTAAAELARFLLLHRDDPESPGSAALLLETLVRLNDTPRVRRLAPGLARRYAGTEVGWRLALADAQGALASGDPSAALRRLEGLEAAEGAARVQIERGRALEALGRSKDAALAYTAAGTAEAQARLAWLNRRGLTLPPLLVDATVVPAEIRPGTQVNITATKLELESLLLRDDGHLDLGQVRLDGLQATLEQRVTIGASGDLPLPHLDRGAYFVAVEIEGTFARAVVLSGALEVRVQPGSGGTLVEVRRADGTPLANAALWTFRDEGTQALRTDPEGRAWAAGRVTAVLARADGAYGWRDLADPSQPVPDAAPDGAEPPPLGSTDAYDALFGGGPTVEVRASGL